MKPKAGDILKSGRWAFGLDGNAHFCARIWHTRQDGTRYEVKGPGRVVDIDGGVVEMLMGPPFWADFGEDDSRVRYVQWMRDRCTTPEPMCHHAPRVLAYTMHFAGQLELEVLS